MKKTFAIIVFLFVCMTHTAGLGFAMFGLDTLRLCGSARETPQITDSAAPIGLAEGLNLYQYGEGNPLAYIDPLGLCSQGSGFWGGVGGFFSDVWHGIGNGVSYIGNVAWDYVGDFLGKIWNAPNTAIGLTWGAAGYGVSALSYVPWALSFGYFQPLDFPTISFGNNAIQFENHPLMITAITLGNTISYNQPYTPQNSGIHEYQHTIQGQWFGLFYLPANIIGGSSATLINGYWHGPLNFMETGPQAEPSRPFPW